MMSAAITTGANAQDASFKVKADTMAPVACTKTVTINASPEKVWSLLTDINGWERWQKDISNCHVEGQPAEGVHFVWKTGGARITSTLHTVKPAQYFGWTGKTFGATAIHNWQITSDNGITKVTVQESMGGFLTRLMKHSFRKNLEKGMERWLTMLKAASEK